MHARPTRLPGSLWSRGTRAGPAGERRAPCTLASSRAWLQRGVLDPCARRGDLNGRPPVVPLIRGSVLDPGDRKEARLPGGDNRRCRPRQRPVLAPTPDHQAGAPPRGTTRERLPSRLAGHTPRAERSSAWTVNPAAGSPRSSRTRPWMLAPRSSLNTYSGRSDLELASSGPAGPYPSATQLSAVAVPCAGRLHLPSSSDTVTFPSAACVGSVPCQYTLAPAMGSPVDASSTRPVTWPAPGRVLGAGVAAGASMIFGAVRS